MRSNPRVETDALPDGQEALHAPASRRTRILALVAESGFMTVGDIASATGVSEITVRRDLAVLEEGEVLRRTHGGAVPLRPGSLPFDRVEPAFEARRIRSMAGKERIARKAAELIAPGETLALDVGTTALALARALDPSIGVRIVTNSLRAAATLADRGLEVHVAGGRVRGREQSVTGARAVAWIGELSFDTAVIGVSGLSEEGYFDYSPEDTEVKRAFMARAARTIVLADASKLMRRALVRIAPLAGVHLLVTDRAPHAGLGSALEREGVRVILAP